MVHLEYNQLKVIRENGTSYIVLKSDYNNWIYRLEVDSSALEQRFCNLRIGLVAVSSTLVGPDRVSFFLFIFGQICPSNFSNSGTFESFKSKGFSGKRTRFGRSISQSDHRRKRSVKSAHLDYPKSHN